jgi:hypothetical protein
MAGKSSRNGNWAPNSPATRYKASGKNREFYTFENAPGLGAYATGGTIIDGGDGYIYHIFTGNGTFTVNRPAAIDSVDYLVVAGGGGGGPISPSVTGGGGGGGGFLFGNLSISAPGSYPIQVGGGGPSTPGIPGVPRNGSPSWFGGPGTLEATGGGGGGGSPAGSGGTGGSGGGGGNAGGGGAGNTPATIPRQGYAGAPVPGGAGPTGAGGGGGGAGGVGGAAPGPTVPGPGGPGRIAPEFPSTIIRRAIPASVLPSWEPLVGSGGYAAGGAGAPVPSRTAPDNSGYGGQTGGLAGGSGIVCIRYKKTVPYSRATGGTIEPSTHPEHPGVWRHIFTSPGTFEVTDPTLQWIDYLAVGGGGGGGGSPTVHGGGGGAGGFVSSIHTSTTTPTSIPEAYPWNPGYSVRVGEQYPVSVGTYSIGIGTGGNAATVGNNTTIGSGPTQIIAYGGGRGGTAPGTGGAGASGGGGAKPAPSTSPVSGGTATPTPLIQGNTGGTTPATPAQTVGSGGGGAGATGSGIGGGGAGWYSVLSPSAYGTPGPLTPTPQYRYFAGGGGGRPSTTGGVGGGGDGSTTTSGTPGTINTGGGGGGGTNADGGTGGPGIVIIQYPE